MHSWALSKHWLAGLGKGLRKASTHSGDAAQSRLTNCAGTVTPVLDRTSPALRVWRGYPRTAYWNTALKTVRNCAAPSASCGLTDVGCRRRRCRMLWQVLQRRVHGRGQARVEEQFRPSLLLSLMAAA